MPWTGGRTRSHNKFYSQSMELSKIQARTQSCSLNQSDRGFTLIELMVTVSLMAVILGLAIPNFREFLVRNRMASLANEFATNMATARNEAITNNTCVTMCMSITANRAIISGTGDVLCNDTSPYNWAGDVYIFRNPTCNATINSPVDRNIVRVTQASEGGYEIINGGADPTPPRSFTFDGRGLLSTNTSANLTLTGPSVSDNNKRTICISAPGRVTIRKYLQDCNV